MPAETFTYRTVRDCQIKVDLYRPKTTVPAPVIVWIHGGALIGGGRGSMQPVVRDMLTADGYAQVSIDYRLAPETLLPDIIDDIREAFRWVSESLPKQCNVDPTRIGVIGGSAGGYLTQMTGFAVAPRPKALVSLYGYGDLIGPWYSGPDPFYSKQPAVSEEEARKVVGATGSAPIADTGHGGPDRFRFYLWCRQNGRWPNEVMGLDPKTHQAAFMPYCPERNIDPKFPPTLLLHGNADTDVPYQRSVDMASVLASKRIVYDFVTIDGGGHGFDGTIKLKDWPAKRDTPIGQSLLRIVDWFTKYV